MKYIYGHAILLGTGKDPSICDIKRTLRDTASDSPSILAECWRERHVLRIIKKNHLHIRMPIRVTVGFPQFVHSAPYTYNVKQRKLWANKYMDIRKWMKIHEVNPDIIKFMDEEAKRIRKKYKALEEQYRYKD